LKPAIPWTHNKGIYNGVDAVIIATGNDFRAVEACGHTYAARNGRYASLTHCSVENGMFKFWIDLPLAVGTIGG
jgi:hydroxymethylglutaryl-CoA reductase